MDPITLALTVTLIPFFTVWTAFYLPMKVSMGTKCSIQAISSGFILGSILLDLMPRVLSSGVKISYLVSFIVGFLFMLLIQQIENIQPAKKGNKAPPLNSFLFPYYIEFAITGILIGIAAHTGASFLVMIAVSFGLCNFICGLSISAKLSTSHVSPQKRFGLGVVMTGILLLGAYLSGVFVQSIPMEWINDLLSFAVAALLFLIFSHLLPMALMEKPKRSLSLIFSGISFIYLVLFLVS
ncbi:MAG: hypothetical protein P0S96_04770 [Simkaniaceae bacterium]|nr:hypothetical protein [Candidatus Sacchlamyda saccharinae]